MAKTNSMLFLTFFLSINLCLLPINSANRSNIATIKLTDIGQFGVLRKAREGVPAHYHTGIDIKRPGSNFHNEPIFPITEGTVISKRTDGPYAQIIVEHSTSELIFWSLYEHVAGISVEVGQLVSPHRPMARFMNKDELNRYGWQFNHFHLEILKIKPIPLEPDAKHPDRFYGSYSLVCYTSQDLKKYYYNPFEFLSKNISY